MGNGTLQPSTTVGCKNQGTIHMSERNLRIIRPGSICADILQNIWNTRNNMSAIVKCQHVNSHMNTYLYWCQILIEQKLYVPTLYNVQEQGQFKQAREEKKNDCSLVMTQGCVCRQHYIGKRLCKTCKA